MSERNKQKTLLVAFTVGPFLGAFSAMFLFGDNVFNDRGLLAMAWMFGCMFIVGLITHKS